MNKQLTEEEATKMYDEMINDCSTVEIGGLRYDASRVLRELDPIAYNCGFNDFIDSLQSDGYEVEGY